MVLVIYLYVEREREHIKVETMNTEMGFECRGNE